MAPSTKNFIYFTSYISQKFIYFSGCSTNRQILKPQLHQIYAAILQNNTVNLKLYCIITLICLVESVTLISACWRLGLLIYPDRGAYFVSTLKTEHMSVLERKRIVETEVWVQHKFETYLEHGRNIPRARSKHTDCPAVIRSQNKISLKYQYISWPFSTQIANQYSKTWKRIDQTRWKQREHLDPFTTLWDLRNRSHVNFSSDPGTSFILRLISKISWLFFRFCRLTFQVRLSRLGKTLSTNR